MDDTAMIAKDYEKRFPSAIRVIHKENGGHGSTINRGIREANGKYFRALDADDWLNTSALKHLVTRLSDTEADLIVSPFCECHEDGTETVISGFSALEREGYYTLEEVVANVLWMPYHALIFRTQMLRERGVVLDEKCFYEDTEYMLYPLPYVNRVYYFNEYLYCYRVGLAGQSVSSASRIKHLDDAWLVTEHLLGFLKNRKETLSQGLYDYMVRVIARQSCFHVRTMLLLPKSNEARDRIMQFDRMVLEASPDVYHRMASHLKAIRILRATRYLAYGMVRWHRSRKPAAEQ